MRTPNVGVDLAGRCMDCGRYTENSAGCTPCWQRRMSEAATTVLTLSEEPVLMFSVLEARQPVFAKLLEG